MELGILSCKNGECMVIMFLVDTLWFKILLSNIVLYLFAGFQVFFIWGTSHSSGNLYPCTLLQCAQVSSLYSFSGGLDVKTQEAALRSGPDILIATPGRLIDHLHNCPSFHLSSVEVLILDEADR